MTPETVRETVMRTCRDQGIATDRSPLETIRLSMLSDTVSAPPVGHDEAFGALDDVEILGTIARGGMGVVQLAEQRSLERAVAVKTLLPNRRGEPWVSGLLREARLTGQLEHPNIVPVHGLGWRDDEGPILVMKRIEGVAWSDLIEDPDHPGWQGANEDGRLARNLEILMEVCQAAEFAHSRGVVHRDIKPLNVMVGAYGEVVLLDWGVATDGRVEGGWRLVGTPAYMAPEMLSASEPDTPRTDVFLLGASLHEVLTGEPRHTGRTVHDVLLRAALSEPAMYAVDVPEELAGICNRACAADPADRFGSARALRQAVADFLRHRSSVATARRAQESLDALLALVAAAEADVFAVHRAFSAARFGFEQALRDWSANGLARVGLRRCLETFARYELDRGNHQSAEPLLAELEEPPPDLVELLERVQALAAEKDRASVELAAMQRDLRVHGVSWARGQLAALNGAITAVILVAAGEWVRHHGVPSLRTVLAFVAWSAALQMGAILVVRRHVLDTRAYRAVMVVLSSMGPVIMTVHVVGALAGADWMQTLAADGVALMCIQIGITALDAAFWVSALIALVTTVVATQIPAFALHAAAVGYLAHTAWVAWALRPRDPSTAR